MKRRLRQTSESEVNLLPMMDVLLCLLAFFILVSIRLKPAQPTLNIQLPRIVDTPGLETSAISSQPLVLQLTAAGQLKDAETFLSPEALESRLQQYFNAYPNGTVLLIADQSLTYQAIATHLSRIQKYGGDRVALAVNSP